MSVPLWGTEVTISVAKLPFKCPNSHSSDQLIISCLEDNPQSKGIVPALNLKPRRILKDMILKAYSRALYASWYLYAPDRLMFDCGEGAASHLSQEIFAVEKIFLSHGHVDHIAGLLSFVCLRHSTKGDNEKPLSIYYPKGDRSVLTMKDAIMKMLGRMLKYELNWIAVEVGQQIELRKGRYMEVFRGDHKVDNPLIYVVNERRKHLKPELQGTPGQELAALSAEEKYAYHTAKIIGYSGDSMPVDPEVYRDVEILLHECTFLDIRDRKYPVHSAIQEVFDLARDANAKRLILTHISPRYFRRVIDKLVSAADSHGIPFDVVIPERVNEFK